MTSIPFVLKGSTYHAPDGVIMNQVCATTTTSNLTWVWWRHQLALYFGRCTCSHPLSHSSPSQKLLIAHAHTHTQQNSPPRHPWNYIKHAQSMYKSLVVSKPFKTFQWSKCISKVPLPIHSSTILLGMFNACSSHTH